MLKSKNEKLQQENGRFLFKQIAANDKLASLFTGLSNAKIFYSTVNYIKRLDFEYVYGWRVEQMAMEEQLFITLQKLRQNYKFKDIAGRYSVSDTFIRNIFFTVLSLLHESLYEEFVNNQNLPSLEKIQNTEQVSKKFPNCRFIIDFTEIYIRNPRKNLEAQRQTYSQYKKRQTLKVVVAVTPKGINCYTSKLFPGSTSDKMIFEESGLSNFLNPGDMILADKGFLIHDLLPQGVNINIPPFAVQPRFRGVSQWGVISYNRSCNQ